MELSLSLEEGTSRMISQFLLWNLWLCTAGTVSSTRITQQPLDQVVVSGHRAVLSCSVYNYTGIVQWTKDGLALGMGNGLPAWPRYRIVGETERGEHDLEIQHAELSDDAVYECQATEVALRSEQAKLTVIIPPDDPVIDGEPEVLLRAGTPYNLTCLAKGAKPAAAIVWYRDGALQEGAAVSQDVMDDGKRETTVSALTITPTDGDIGRVYTCRTSNEALPAGKDTIVTLNVHHVPTVTLSIHPQRVREGDHVVFTCTASANPDIESYRWSKGGVPIDGARGSVYETPVDHTYFTEPVSCEVRNAVGRTNVSSLVDVEFGPRLLQEPQTTTADLGDSVTLTCNWVGNPPLTLTWTKRGSNMVLSNSNHLHLKAVTQADSGNYICKAIVPRIGVGERQVTLHINGPPIISSEAVQYAAQGDRGKVECYIVSTPLPDRIAWSWKEYFLETGSVDRFSVETVRSGQGVRSTLLITNVAEMDFLNRYNCTAWNGFGPGTALIQLHKEDVLPIGIIIGVTVGVGIVLTLFLIGLALVLYRRRKRSRRDVTLGKPDVKVETVIKEPQLMNKEMDEEGSNISTATRVMKVVYSAFKDDMDLKSDLRSDTIDTREDGELKDPTNGYYNVRAQDDRPSSRTLLYSDYRPPGPRFDPRPPSRLSHGSGYAQAEGASQLSYEPYPYPGYPPYGAAHPRAGGYDPYDAKFPGASRYSYCSSQHAEHGRCYQQRMQTHV